MKTKHYNFTKFVADDNREFDTELEAAQHNVLLAKIKSIEKLLGGPQNKKVADNKGYYQHTQTNISKAWGLVIELSRPYFKSYENLKNLPADQIHPMGLGGRIISECADDTINKMWWRFSCIDKEGREWQQPYFALNTGTGTQTKIN